MAVGVFGMVGHSVLTHVDTEHTFVLEHATLRYHLYKVITVPGYPLNRNRAKTDYVQVNN